MIIPYPYLFIYNPKVLKQTLWVDIKSTSFTTNPTGQGTGLGLCLSYDIFKAHGGELRFESEKNVKTIFYIYLKK